MESDAFLLGIWKDFQELEESISMPELSAILVAKHNDDYEDKRFAAALKGVKLDAPGTQEVTFSEYANDVISKHTGISSNDVLSLSGAEAEREGFGIGYGLDYEVVE